MSDNPYYPPIFGPLDKWQVFVTIVAGSLLLGLGLLTGAPDDPKFIFGAIIIALFWFLIGFIHIKIKKNPFKKQ